jgi:protein-S-isoprenylcysteine O-methyltransferase Ste14
MKVEKWKISEVLVKLLMVIFLLEPVWMLLPFAGFLYGSAVNLDFLTTHPETAWLTFFLFPVQTLLPAAIALTFIGGLIFLAGAFQIYGAKLKKSGLVTSGIYKKFRHPQYTGLTLICIGFLLIWGRFITYLLFATMFYSYYHLAEKEEKECGHLFAQQYEEYKINSYFLFPGEKILTPVKSWFHSTIKLKYLRGLVAYICIIAVTLGFGIATLKIRKATQNHIPVVSQTVDDENGKAMEIIMVQDTGAKIESMNTNAFKNFILALYNDPKFRSSLNEFKHSGADTLLGFGISRTLRPQKPYYRDQQYDFYMLILSSDVKYDGHNFANFRKNWKIKGAIEIERVDIRAINNNIILGEVKEVMPRGMREVEGIEAFANAYFYSLRPKVVPIYKLIEK